MRQNKIQYKQTEMKINLKNPFAIITIGGAVLFLLAVINFIPSVKDITMLQKAIDALFTISTVAFSSLMCVTFMFDYSGVDNPEKRDLLKRSISSVRWLLIFCILATTLTFITIDTSSVVNAWCAFALILILTIGYFGYMAKLFNEYEEIKMDEKKDR